jgi:probable phosphoglycerate mutase
LLPTAVATGSLTRIDREARDADLGTPTTLIMVRHGRTDDTDQRRVRGRASTGPALNAAGHEEAQGLARRLVDRAESAPPSRPVLVIASPLLRARQTAITLGRALGLEPQLDDDWAEVALGDWDGLGYAEIADGWPTEYLAWRTSTAAAPPRGESLDDVGKRVGAACDRLVHDHPGQTVLVVSHTAPIRTVIARALDAGPSALWRLRVDPASVSVVRFWADGGCEVSTVNSGALAAVP